MQKEQSSVENGEVNDDEEMEESVHHRVRKDRLSVASESEVREEEDEYAYTDPHVYSKAASLAVLDSRLGQLNAYSSLQQITQSPSLQQYLMPPSTQSLGVYSSFERPFFAGYKNQ